MLSQNALNNQDLARIAAQIVRTTIANHGDAKLAIEPYSNAVRRLVARELTHFECREAGLISQNCEDGVETYLRHKAKELEDRRYATITQPIAA